MKTVAQRNMELHYRDPSPYVAVVDGGVVGVTSGVPVDRGSGTPPGLT